MKIEGKLATCTINELAKYLAENIEIKDGYFKSFQSCDFGIIDESDAKEDDLECVRSGVCGWYGIKDVDAGFDSDCMILISDYYGGSCASMSQIWDDGMGLEYAAQDIEKMLLNTLNNQETAKSNTMLLVEFTDKKSQA